LPVEPGFEPAILAQSAWARRAAANRDKGWQKPRLADAHEGNAMTWIKAARRRGRRALLIEQNRGDDAAS
jgi:hypothetical protein